MNATFEYKGYIGSAEVDVEGGTLAGRLLYIRDTIAYCGDSIAELETAFREAVDDYLRVCIDEGDEPDVPLKGSFNVRVGPDRHRKIAIAARRAGVGLNEFVCSALDEILNENRGSMHTAGDVILMHTDYPAETIAFVYGQTGKFEARPKEPMGRITTSSSQPIEWVKSGSSQH